MPLFDHFGILAPFYEFFIKPAPPEMLWQLADLPASGILLDAGGGTGRVAQFMNGKIDQIVVADLSFPMLQQAQQKDGLRAVNAHTERLPFPDACFDRVIMVDALHHVCDQHETAAALWRVLKPGGRIVIEEPDLGHFGVKLVAIAEKLALMRSHFLSPAEIVSLFDNFDARARIEKDGYISWVIIERS